MSWKPDALWTKAKVYTERALNEDRESQMFPFWCSLSLELLARSTLAFVNPALLAEPTREMENILYALDIPMPKGSHPKSIQISAALTLCKTLIPTFTEQEYKTCMALINKRNEELHSGGLPFESWPTTEWLPGFYRACKVLVEYQKKSLEEFLGEEEAGTADALIQAADEKILTKVKKSINARKQIFEEKKPEVRERIAATSKAKADQAAHSGQGHRVTCPACGSTSTVRGEPVSTRPPQLEKGMIAIRETRLPTEFLCGACDLELNGHPELHAAGIGGLYTHLIKFDPVGYYGGYTDDSPEEEHPEEEHPEEEYDNE